MASTAFRSASRAYSMRFDELRGQRVAVWGAGREGRAAIAALRARAIAAAWIVSDKELEACRAFAPGVELLDEAALTRFDVVVKSPGISPYKPPASDALARGVRFTSGTALWFAEHADARTIAVTGTKGKSTTAALVAHLLRAGGHRTALAGNIGLPLLELGQDAEFWVIELSSFQTRDAVTPEVAVLTNLYEEHLDWHGTRERYRADKLALFDTARTKVLPGEGSWHVREGAIRRGDEAVCSIDTLGLPGEHNALNACAALAAIDALGLDAAALAGALATFRALPHRLQPLGAREGLDWIDDSISTTPHATLAALAYYGDRSVCALLGGYDRGVDWTDFAARVAVHPPHALVTMGQAGPRIRAALRDDAGYVLRDATTLESAVEIAREITPRGGVVLLSPGAPSFGEFTDYIARGRRFALLAGFDPERSSAIPGLGIA